MTTEEAAEVLGTSATHVRRLIRQNKIKGELRASSHLHWYVDAVSVHRYAQKKRSVGRPLGSVSTEPARSKLYGVGTQRAEEVREYNRIAKRQWRARKAARRKGK